MMRRTVCRQVRADPSNVMGVLLDVRQWHRWRPGVASTSHLTDDYVMLASAWQAQRRLAGRLLNFWSRAIHVEPPHVFAYVATGDGFDAAFRWTVRLVDGATLVTQETGVRTHGLRNAFSGAAKALLDQQDAALDNLHHFLQSTKPQLANPQT